MRLKAQLTFGSIFDRIISSLFLLAAAVLIVMMLMVCADVFLRYFFNSPLTWVMAISEYFMAWMTFLAAAWLLKKERHAIIDVVVNRLPQGTQVVFNMITSSLSALALLVLTWYTGQITLDYFVTDFHTASRPVVPLGPIFLIMPIGSLLFSIQFMRRAYGFLSQWSRSKGQGATSATQEVE